MRLLEAAGRVIGKYGYAGCTISRVTTRAKIAHGTFYLHFQSQQHLFDTVLPVLGSRMLRFIGEAVHDSLDVLDLERRGFEASFAYLYEHPYMARVTEEAALYAPEAYRQHIDEMITGYTRSLLRSKTGTQIEDFRPEELKTLAHLLIGARLQLMWQYRRDNQIGPEPPREKVETYLKFVSHGILGVRAPARKT